MEKPDKALNNRDPQIYSTYCGFRWLGVFLTAILLIIETTLGRNRVAVIHTLSFGEGALSTRGFRAVPGHHQRGHALVPPLLFRRAPEWLSSLLRAYLPLNTLVEQLGTAPKHSQGAEQAGSAG